LAPFPKVPQVPLATHIRNTQPQEDATVENEHIPTLDECLEAHGIPGIHPAAGLFPLIDSDEMQDLIESITHDGLEQDIVLTHDGLLLDGRNRLIACTAAGVKPKFRRLPEDYAEDYWGYAIRMNLRRRHLTASQRATIAVRAKEYYAELAKERLRACGGWKGNQYKKPEAAPFPKVAQANKQRSEAPLWAHDMAGRAHGVSGTYVDYAEKIKKTDPKLFEEIAAGKKTISQAWREIFPVTDKAGISDPLTTAPQTRAEAIRMAENILAKRRQEREAQVRAERERVAAERHKGRPTEQTLHGDPAAMLKDLDDESIDCVVADPFGITDDIEQAAALWEDTCHILKEKLRPGGHLYAFAPWDGWQKLAEATEKNFKMRNLLMWATGDDLQRDPGRMYASRYKAIIFATKGHSYLFGPVSGDVLGCRRLPNGDVQYTMQDLPTS